MIRILTRIVIGIVVGFEFGLLSSIPIIGSIISLADTLVDLHITASLVFSIPDCLKLLK